MPRLRGVAGEDYGQSVNLPESYRWGVQAYSVIASALLHHAAIVLRFRWPLRRFGCGFSHDQTRAFAVADFLVFAFRCLRRKRSAWGRSNLFSHPEPTGPVQCGGLPFRLRSDGHRTEQGI